MAAGKRRPASGPTNGTHVEVDGRRFVLSNREKILYPETGFTKAQVIDYYARIAPVMVPHLAGRPVTLVRCPNGVEGERFFEKRCPPHHPDWIPEIGELNQCDVDEPAALVWLANLAALELHTLQARAVTPDTPDAVVFDLDPGPPAGALDAAAVAMELRDLLGSIGLVALVKTSGSKGLHLSVPLHTDVDASTTKTFALTLGNHLAQLAPDRVTTDMTKAKRPGKVFVDWSQNDRHKTTVCAYSLRARRQPTVSTPLTWEEVAEAVANHDARALVFETADVLARVDELGDLFADNVALEQRLPHTGTASA
ncbi:MAG: non-homologous end-joining DNA ligase [Acidimicrobiia bacterium]